MGSLETCTHIILRSKEIYSLFVSIAKNYFHPPHFLDPDQDIVGSSKLITEWPAFQCWIFCNEQLASDDEHNDEMREMLDIHYVSIGQLSGIAMGSE